ncbi:MAG: hypothetical protein HGA25_06115, partial [Clostridiales bacterium]|nr:hypothetical protein [Clostridiales bacterium]
FQGGYYEGFPIYYLNGNKPDEKLKPGDIVTIEMNCITEEYYQSEEGQLFPIHCEYGTTDWKLSIDISGLPNQHFLLKNQFNMWGEKGAADIWFTSPQKKIAFDSLFHITDDPYEPTRSVPRDVFIAAMSPDHSAANIEVTMIGVASDYCIRYAMEGWLARGARVTIIHDLTKGIEKETPQIIDEYRYHHKASGRLRSMAGADYLQNLTENDA